MKLRRKKRILFFLLVPFLSILISIFYFNKFNKNQLKAKFAEITLAEGTAIRRLVEISGLHLAQEGEERLTTFLNRLYANEAIIYIGLFKGDRLIYLLSRYEGYFPVIPGQGEFRFLDTPVGKIFEITGRFEGRSTGDRFRLYIGFNYEFLTAFESAAGRNFLVVAGVFALVVLFIIALVIYFDRKFFQKELELVEEKQEKERFKELSLLTAEIAHEIKNPLNSIYLSFNTLEKYFSADEEAVFYRDAIKGEIKRIAGVLQSYAELSREIRPEVKEILIKDFIAEFQWLTAEEARTRSVDFQVESRGAEVFKTDKNMLKQILLNLVKNALEAEASRVSVDFNAAGEFLTVEVKDNGKGIAGNLSRSIFKPYISTKTKGMGLGLHITKRLVEALKGKIELISTTPGNTVFRLTLPVYKAGV